MTDHLCSSKLLSDYDLSLFPKIPSFVAHVIIFYHLPPFHILDNDTPLNPLFHIPEDFSIWTTATLSIPTFVIILGDFSNNLSPAAIICQSLRTSLLILVLFTLTRWNNTISHLHEPWTPLSIPVSPFCSNPFPHLQLTTLLPSFTEKIELHRRVLQLHQ